MTATASRAMMAAMGFARTWPIVALAAGLSALQGARDLSAQPFGWFYGGPRAYRPYKPRRRAVPPSPIEIPLPIPRPHFPTDPPVPETAGRPVAPPAEAAKPAEHPATSAEPTLPGTAKGGPMGPPPPPFPPEKPPELAAPAAVPRIPKVEMFGPFKPGLAPPKIPAIAPSGANTAFTPRLPPADPTCRGRLTAQNVATETVTIDRQPDPRCIVAEGVRLGDLTLPDGTKVDFPEKPTLACVTAEAFSAFVRDLLAPLAKGTYGVSIAAVWTGPGLDCRSRDHIKGAKLSAHGLGLAVDIAQMKLADGRILTVGKTETERDKAFQHASQAAGCGYFHTALGPGTDSFHSNHWHFDLEQRGSAGDSKYCR